MTFSYFCTKKSVLRWALFVFKHFERTFWTKKSIAALIGTPVLAVAISGMIGLNSVGPPSTWVNQLKIICKISRSFFIQMAIPIRCKGRKHGFRLQDRHVTRSSITPSYSPRIMAVSVIQEYKQKYIGVVIIGATTRETTKLREILKGGGLLKLPI